MTAIACAQPGCTGTLLDDYCDVCGSPAGPSGSPVRSAGSTTPKSASSTARLAADRPIASQPAGIGSSPSTVSRASSRLASTALGSARARGGSTTTGRLGTSSKRLRGARLGAGLTTIPPIPAVDAAAAIMANPEVPETKRACPSCGSPVGRSRDGQPGRTEGFCAKCRNPFSFAPKLAAGDLVGGQYEVAGCLAHGGLGWIYLARDRNVSNRWVVLKGLLNAGDADALAAAIAERQFLAQVEHPLIVEIYNFVTHEDAGYIVMEYVGGTSLKQLLKSRMQAAGGRYDPLPVDQAIAFIVEILPAFQYLHDLGGVRRLDDVDSAIYGTVGYQAPEVAEVGASVASDIFTIGRTLLVLAMEFRGYQSTYLSSLPPVSDTPLFQEHDSFYRLLAKTCAPDPDDRFTSADELRVQLLGVLREVVADHPGAGAAAHSTSSLLFEVPAVSAETLGWQDLPGLRADEHDAMTGWLHTVSVEDPKARLEALTAAPQSSPEVLLAMASAALHCGRLDVVDTVVAEMLTADPWEWRAVWMSGLAGLARGDATAAQSEFNAVYGQVPGELAPKLALALACETSGELDVAEALYTTCARTDANYIAPSAFGLARIRSGRGDLDGAISALDLVPPTSRAFTQARRQRAGQLAASGRGLPALSEAMNSIDSLTIDPLDRATLSVSVLDAALDEVRTKGSRPDILIAGLPAAEPSLRQGLEAAYRELAGYAKVREDKVRLVDQANSVREWTVQ
jgi:serine/threonine-protein kinase PknG